MHSHSSVSQGHVNPTVERRALRAIAIYEAIKGLAAIASAIGLLSLLHHDLRRLVLELVGHFGLDPAEHFPSLLLHYVDVLNGTPISTVLMLAGAYASVRFAETYGLWHERPWGEWLGALSGAIYIPFELRHLMHSPNIPNAMILLLNLAMVLFLAYELAKRRSNSR